MSGAPPSRRATARARLSDINSYHRVNGYAGTVMSMLPSRWNTRCRILTVARAMLLLWVFGVAAGWVNACLPQHGSAPAGHMALHDPGADAESAATTSGADASHDAGTAEQNCQRLCDASATAIPKVKVLSLDDAPAAMPAAVGLGWTPRDAAVGEPARRPDPPPPAQAPVAIRFLRLTL